MLEWLENWYNSQCDGDWKHQYGIKIETIDNPGWEITIDLEEIIEKIDIKKIDWNIIGILKINGLDIKLKIISSMEHVTLKI